MISSYTTSLDTQPPLPPPPPPTTSSCYCELHLSAVMASALRTAAMICVQLGVVQVSVLVARQHTGNSLRIPMTEII